MVEFLEIARKKHFSFHGLSVLTSFTLNLASAINVKETSQEIRRRNSGTQKRDSVLIKIMGKESGSSLLDVCVWWGAGLVFRGALWTAAVDKYCLIWWLVLGELHN